MEIELISKLDYNWVNIEFIKYNSISALKYTCYKETSEVVLINLDFINFKKLSLFSIIYSYREKDRDGIMINLFLFQKYLAVAFEIIVLDYSFGFKLLDRECQF
jgi:hypothetical protein